MRAHVQKKEMAVTRVTRTHTLVYIRRRCGDAGGGDDVIFGINDISMRYSRKDLSGSSTRMFCLG